MTYSLLESDIFNVRTSSSITGRIRDAGPVLFLVREVSVLVSMWHLEDLRLGILGVILSLRKVAPTFLH